jgi:outer membrane protein OmpA-like peptidoglycan-associated protein
MKFASVFLYTMAPLFLWAQNLVPNGSFEDYVECPGSYSQMTAEFRVPSWRSITTGSPDYFNICSRGEAAVPYNWAGVSEAFDGKAYVGIYLWMNLPKEYREYLHCKLKQPLVKDSLYHIEFRYKLSSYSKFCTDRIGILLSDSLKPVSNDLPLSVKPTFSFIKDSALTLETGSWEVASAEYRAKGNEQFLTIGNFFDNESTHSYRILFRPAQQPMLAEAAYYYVDDVKVIPRFPGQEEKDKVPLDEDREPELNKVYVLKDIRFESNSYALLPVSYDALDSIAFYLHNHPALSVRLSGHTDDLGTEEYNLTLSAQRAESAAAYLKSRGIAGRRITTAGYGKTRPLLEENTEEARRVNRRVEVEFYR